MNEPEPMNEYDYMDNSRPFGRDPIPEDRVGEMIEVFELEPEIQMVFVFPVHAEGAMQSDATFGIWCEDGMPLEEKIDVLRRLARAFHLLVDSHYYLDLMLISPQDNALWSYAHTNGNLVYCRDEEVIARAQIAHSAFEDQEEPDTDIQVLRVL